MEQTGSEKKYSFCIPPERETKRVVVYEACIDALAHMTLEEGRGINIVFPLEESLLRKKTHRYRVNVLKSCRMHWKSF